MTTTEFSDWEVEADWQDVAEVLARQILFDAGYVQSLKQLDEEARQGFEKEMRFIMSDAKQSTGWEARHVAAELLRDLDRRFPMARGEVESVRCTTEFLKAQNEATDEHQRRDPVKSVLVSPRLRDNTIIERIVHTYAGRVEAEFLYETGWRRAGRRDLCVIVSSPPLPTCVARALSRKRGELDTLPADEILSRLRSLDPRVTIGAAAGERIGPCGRMRHADTCTLSRRITQTELNDDPHAAICPECAMAGSDAMIAAELLRITPGLWTAVKVAVETTEEPGAGGFRFTITGSDSCGEKVPPSLLLRMMVARRFEHMEDVQGRAWKRFTFAISRSELPEWHAESVYQYV